MKFVFLGSSNFSSIVLKRIYNKINIAFTITKEPKRGGRGLKLVSTSVKKTSDSLGIECIETDNPDNLIPRIKKEKIDGFILASYGAILSKELLSSVKYPLNIHPSLLPKYRGPTPIQRTLQYGETETGVTIFIMDEGIDTGDIVMQKSVKILPFEVATELEERLAELGGDMMIEVVKNLEEKKKIERIKQDHSKATYTKKIKPEELLINWNEPAETIVNKIRSFAYEPGAYTFWREKRLKIFRAIPIKGKTGNPGSILSLRGFIFVAAQDGMIGIKELQLQGKKKMDVEVFLNGHKMNIGEYLG